MFIGIKFFFYKVESLILSALKKLAKTYDKPAAKKEFEKLGPALDKILKDESEQVALEYFDFQSWVDSKISELNFADAVKKAS